jgi:HD-like signal output (HDOD) protein
MESTDTVVLSDDYAAVRSAAEAFAAELEASLTEDGIDLPSLPEVALKIRDALARDDTDIERVAELAGGDPALAAKLLKVANCALFHRGTQPVRDLRSAVVRLGLRMVRNVAMSIAAQQVFIGYGSKAIRPRLAEVWQHSVHVATLAHLLSAASDDILPEEAFLAGLLHEVGTLYILLRAKDHDALFANTEAFDAVLLAWKARMGAGIAAHWRFPDPLVAAVGEHDAVSLAAGPQPSLTEIVAVSNYLAERISAADNPAALLDDLPDLGTLALDPDMLEQLIAASSDDLKALQDALAA